MDRIWDKFVTEQDKAVFQAAGYGKSIGYGKRPALVVIDTTASSATNPKTSSNP